MWVKVKNTLSILKTIYFKKRNDVKSSLSLSLSHFLYLFVPPFSISLSFLCVHSLSLAIFISFMISLKWLRSLYMLLMRKGRRLTKLCSFISECELHVSEIDNPTLWFWSCWLMVWNCWADFGLEVGIEYNVQININIVVLIIPCI